ncbi:DUF6420 family protein [Streptomyces bacillaris]
MAVPLVPKAVRAVLAIELGDLVPAGRIVQESEARFGPVLRTEGSDEEE